VHPAEIWISSTPAFSGTVRKPSPIPGHLIVITVDIHSVDLDQYREVRSAFLLDPLDDLTRKSDLVLLRSRRTGPCAGWVNGGHELIDQIAVGAVDLNAITSGLLDSLGSLDELTFQVEDLVDRELVWPRSRI